jgi:hypothetical protein
MDKPNYLYDSIILQNIVNLSSIKVERGIFFVLLK